MLIERNPASDASSERGTMSTAPLTPKALAEEIGIDPKSLRGYLRKNFTRTAEAKNTSWIITPEAADAAREHFAKQETPEPAKA